MSRFALDALTPEEKAAVLDELLQTRPELLAAAEHSAARRLGTADRGAVAEQVSTALKALDQGLLVSRAGYQPSEGYVHETQAANDILGETLRPFHDDIERRAALGMSEAAAETGLGVLLGLYDCRDFHEDEALLAYAEDFPLAEAQWVINRLRRLGIVVPEHEVKSTVQDWDLP